MQHALFTYVEHSEKRRTHHDCTDSKQQKDAANFSEQIFETRHRLGKNRVDGAVFDVLGDEPRRRNDCQQRRKDRHRAKRNIFQDLKFLLKSELRHEDGAADQQQGKHQQDIKNF